jgi:CBS-domain-containing membrane protein
MVATIKNLALLTAGDVMSRDVSRIPQEMSLPAAARLLEQERISGAPVVDEEGRCVGVISAKDFLRWAERGEQAPAVRPATECVCADWQVIVSEELPRDEVRWYMTTDLVTADPGTALPELARRMLDSHIHRLVVVDGQRRPVGIVTSTDILAAVAYLARHETRK